MLCRHPSHGFACAEEAADDIRGKNAVEPGRVHLLDARLCLQDPGIVDQGGNAAKGGIDLREKTHDVFFAAHIGLNRHGLAPRGGDVAHHGFGSLPVRQVGNAHGIARRCGQTGRCRADPSSPSGDDNHFFHVETLLDLHSGKYEG